MSFGIVNFIKSKEVAVVPINWIRNDQCLWPPKNLRDKTLPFLSKGITASETWDLHPIKIIGIFVTYSDARAKLAKAEYKSDLNESDMDDYGRGKREHRKRRFSSSSTASELSESLQLEEPPVFPKVGRPGPYIINFKQIDSQPADDSFTLSTEKENCDPSIPNSESLLAHAYINKPVNENVDSYSHRNANLSESIISTPKPSTSLGQSEHIQNTLSESIFCKPKPLTSPRQSEPVQNTFSAFEKTVLRELKIIKSNQRHIMETMDSALNFMAQEKKDDVNIKSSHLIENILKCFPLSNMVDLDATEEKLKQENSFNEMVNYFQKLGGCDGRQAVKFMLSKMFTDAFATAFSFKGVRGKKAFKPLKLCFAVFSAMRSHPLFGNSEAEVERIISDWLRHASGRSKKKSVF